MQSFDIFDTLIGRWYYTPESIAEELGKTLKIENFAWYRKHAESLSKRKTFADIHNELQGLLGYDNVTRNLVMKSEFNLECERTFPIIENVRKLTEDSVLISDTYFNPEELSILLAKNRIFMYKRIISSYDGKSSGKVWANIRPTAHIGDNLHSDYKVPRDFGISSEHYTNSLLNGVENTLVDLGYSSLAYLSRRLRLENTFYSAYSDVWNEQVSINIPMLILISRFIYDHFMSKGFSIVLFTQRDCHNLSLVFNKLYPGVRNKKLFSNRDLYNSPTPGFTDYTDKLIAGEKPLVVDLQGTGNSFLRYFQQLGVENYLPIVYSDLDKEFPFEYIAHRRDGISDKIERINYSPFTKNTDVRDGVPTSYPHSNNYIATQQHAIQKFLQVVDSGFALDIQNNNIKGAVNYLLLELEKDCKIARVVNHEEI